MSGKPSPAQKAYGDASPALADLSDRVDARLEGRPSAITWRDRTLDAKGMN
jgi:hypothetical protein